MRFENPDKMGGLRQGAGAGGFRGTAAWNGDPGAAPGGFQGPIARTGPQGLGTIGGFHPMRF